MQVLGISQDGDEVFFALLKKKRKGLAIRSLFYYPVKDLISDVKQFYILKEKAPRAHLVSGLSSQDILIRPLRIKLNKVKDLKKTLPFQEESLSLLAQEETLFASITQKEKDGHQVILLQTPKSKLENHLAHFQKMNIHPDTVSSESMALTRFVHFLAPELTETIIFHLGKQTSFCVLVKENAPLSSHSLSLGVDHFLKSLKLDLEKQNIPVNLLEKQASHLDLLTLKKKDFPHFYDTILRFKKESSQILLSFGNKEGVKKIPMVLTGYIDLFPQIHEILFAGSEEIISHVYQDQTNEKNSASLLRYAIPIGLAIDVSKKDSLSCQFLQNAFLPACFFRKMARKILLIFSIACIGMISIIFCTHSVTKKSYSKAAKELEEIYQKNPSLTPSNKESLSLQKQLVLLEKNLFDDLSSFPFFLKVPTFSQFLTWLNKQEGFPKGIDIRSCRYRLESLPTISTPRDPFLAKVTIHFFSPTKEEAESFVGFLQKDPFISQCDELLLDAAEDHYEITMTLHPVNNETLYLDQYHENSR